MGIFVTLNLLGIRLLARTNSAITVFKLAIPLLTAIALMVAGFHIHNFTAAGGFFVRGGAGPVQAILSAITAGGIAFALMGFEGALEVGARAPILNETFPAPCSVRFLLHRDLHCGPDCLHRRSPAPLAFALFKLDSAGNRSDLSRAPFFVLAGLVGLVWLAWIMRLDAVVSPGGTGMLYLTGASRLSFGLSKDGYVPKLFLVEDERTDVPLWGVIMSGGWVSFPPPFRAGTSW